MHGRFFPHAPVGFGKLKFFRKRKEDAGYIKNFLLFQPMMTYIGWYAQRLSKIVGKTQSCMVSNAGTRSG